MAGIYVHIPFCRSKCGYCDFHSVPQLKLADSYLDALEGEVGERCAAGADTLYVGGGTPSALSLKQLGRLFSMLPSPGRGECTIEVNPDDVTEDFVAFLTSETPVNRVSMGVQSMVEAELALAGRRHSPERVAEACRLFHRHGIDNLSLDLIYGLPGQTIDSWRYSLGALLELSPCHLSAYMLTYEPRTRFTAMRDAGKLAEASEDTLVGMYDALIEATRRAGMEHYEISNFALPGMRARHNSSYWSGADYIGLGTGAHSYINGVRGYNPQDIRGYINACGRGFYVEEQETPENLFNDMLITRLRTSDGLSLDSLTGEDAARLLKAASKHLAAGRMSLDGHILRICETSWLVSDNILIDLIK